MADSYTNLLYHIVFSTKGRRPLITSEYEPLLYDYIGGTVRGVGGISLELNGTADHVHLLTILNTTSDTFDIPLSRAPRAMQDFLCWWFWGGAQRNPRLIVQK